MLLVAETSGLKRRLARLDATPSTVPEQEYRFLPDASSIPPLGTDENHKVTAGQRFLALLGVTKEAHATEDVTVDWAAPLIGTQRQSVWHILRGEAVEKACRRVAARGVL